MILSGLKAERLFSSFFFFFFLSPDPFYLDNLKLVELISRQFKAKLRGERDSEQNYFIFLHPQLI